MGKISTFGVLRLRATKRCVTQSICEALRSEVVTFLVHYSESIGGWVGSGVRRDMGNKVGEVEPKGAVRLRRAERNQLSL